MIGLQAIVKFLGLAGLIPFVVPAVLIAAGSVHSQLLLIIASSYAFGIICFLTGSWWGRAITTAKKPALVLSNIIFLIAFFAYLFAPPWWPLIAALLLISLYTLEQHTALFADFSHPYRNIRAVLSLVASLSMLVIFITA